MNKIEFWLMNNPIRSFIQIFEAKDLRKLSDLPIGGDILEIGCGQGVGTQLINKYFEPKKIVAIDLDPKMIKRAKKKAKDKDIYFQLGDASKLGFKNNSFDAIVDFGIIHHIPNWQDCLTELYRVLKPGGQIIIKDFSIETFSQFGGSLLRKMLDHPYEEMYQQKEFFSALEKLGFKIINKKVNRYWFSLIAKK